MTSRRTLGTLAILALIAAALAASCAPKPANEGGRVSPAAGSTREAATTTAGAPGVAGREPAIVQESTAGPEAPARMGGWFDTVVFVSEPDAVTAVARLEAGEIDVFAVPISEPDIAQMIMDSERLAYVTAYGGSDELTFMPSTGPEFRDGRLNPFYSGRIREAMNWLIDRDYICQEMMGGLSVPRFVPINYASKDSALLAEPIAAIALQYAHNPEKAVAVIAEEMEGFGATMEDGRWIYKGEPVVLTGLIRTEDERLELGDYVSNLLEDIGFTVQREYSTGAEASPCWLRGDPDEGCAHYYTGAWISTSIDRDAGGSFRFFYTPDGLPFPPWQAYTPSPEFYEIATRLGSNDFRTMGERAELMAQALSYALEDSQRIWLKDDVSITPHAADIRLAGDLSGALVGSDLWAQTMRREGVAGGSVTIAFGASVSGTWNPISAASEFFSGMPVRGMMDNAVVPDPFTGLALPMRLERAHVAIQQGLPVDATLEWTETEFVPEIVVPDDAWADWDAGNQVFITAGERFTQTETAASKVVMYYEPDLFDRVTWHDGSPLTLGDVVMSMILAFDRAKEASPNYDESSVPAFEAWMSAFKGWRIVSEDPLVVEYYTDAYRFDAENNVSNLAAAYPFAAWHSLAPGLRADAASELAFSAEKAAAREVEWMSFIAGPSLGILKAQLDAAQAEGFIPFEPTLGQFISAGELASRYQSLQAWVGRTGHFLIGTGPYYLEQIFPVEGTFVLRHNQYYPDPATRWDRFSAAPVPQVVVDGPGTVTRGEEAVYDIHVTFADEPYAVDDIDMVRFLVLDASREPAYTGDATPLEDGHWQVVLSADMTAGLAIGSNQLAAIAVSKLAVVPARDAVQFVTQ